MAQTIVRQRVVGNPGRRKRRARKRSRNPGEILGFVLSPTAGNPGRKRRSMAKTKRNRGGYAKKNRSPKRRRKNPGMRMKRNTHHRVSHRHRANPGMRRNRHHRRRNPGENSVGAMFTNAIFVIVGALGSKLGAQAVLGTNNVGIVGYAGNAATGAVLWFLADRVMKNRNAANGIVAGTLVQIILRIINDYTPFGQYVANLGMGDYQMQSFVTPQVLVDPMRNADIRIPRGWGPGMSSGPPMSATAGMRQVRGGGAPAPSPTATTAPAAAATGVGNLYGGGFSSLYGA